MIALLLACSSAPVDTADSGDPDPGDDHDTADTGGDDLPAYTGGTGPFSVRAEDDEVDGAAVTWFVPTGGENWPVVVWAHGFARSKANHADAAERLASWGFLVVTPTLPSFSDHAGNGQWIATVLVPEAQSRPQTGDKLALVGHSAGGLATLVAAAEVGPDLWLGLDPVDNGGLGADLADTVTNEAITFAGESSDCNADGSGHTWTTGGARWRLDFVDATHCDFEFPSDSLCTSFCGGDDDARRALVLDYAVAALVDRLGGGADAWMEGGETLAADVAAGKLRTP